MRLRIWGMGIASQDLTGDGYPEVYLTSQADNKLQTLANGPAEPTYKDIALRRGAIAHRPFTGGDPLPSTAWHPSFEDLNNDGFTDLYVSKGNVDAQEDYATRDPSNLLIGQADGTFVEGATAAGIVDFAKARGAALVDLNADGMLDLVQVVRRENVRLWRNVGSGDVASPEPMGRWIGVGLDQDAPNHDAIGAWIDVRDRSHSADQREVTIGGGHVSGQLGPIHFGLGAAVQAEVRVTWPDGEVGPWLTIAANNVVLVQRGADGGSSPWCPEGGASMPKSNGARLAVFDLPDFGRPASTPDLPAALYAARLRRLRERMEARGYDRLVVYADREHSANLAYLTGFDPRFEEAILVVSASGDPAILVGNECYGMAGAAPLPMRRHWFQDLSLPGQPRDRSRSLSDDPRAMRGSTGPSRVGVIGWKPYRRPLDARRPGLPRRRAASNWRAERARSRTPTDLLIDPADGLRVINEVEQLAAMEAAACTTSNGVRGLLTGPPTRDARARGGGAARLGRLAAVVPPDADRRRRVHGSGCSAPATGRSSAATRSRSRSASGAR